MNDEFTLMLDDQDELELSLEGNELEFSLEGETPIMDDYNMLRHKPEINGVTLQGSMSFSDFFASGELIIDGGSAEVI